MLLHAQQPLGIDKEYVVYWGIFAFLALLASLLALYIGVMCSHIAAFNILYTLRVRLADHIAKLPMGFHTKTATGELKKIIEVSVEKIEKFIAHQLPDISSAIIMPVLLIGYLFWLDWRLALVLLIPIIIGLLLQVRLFGSEMGQQSKLFPIGKSFSYSQQILFPIQYIYMKMDFRVEEKT